MILVCNSNVRSFSFVDLCIAPVSEITMAIIVSCSILHCSLPFWTIVVYISLVLCLEFCVHLPGPKFVNPKTVKSVVVFSSSSSSIIVKSGLSLLVVMSQYSVIVLFSCVSSGLYCNTVSLLSLFPYSMYILKLVLDVLFILFCRVLLSARLGYKWTFAYDTLKFFCVYS